MKTKGKGSRTRLRRSLKRDEYIIWRNKKGQIRKFRSDVQLVAEVRNKKTKRRVGFFNEIENGKVKAKKYTSSQRTFLEAVSIPTRARKEKAEKGRDRFTLYSSEPIRDQIPDWLYEDLVARIERYDEAVIGFYISGNGFDNRSESAYYGETPTRSDFLDRTTRQLLLAFWEVQIRTSGKKHGTRHPKYRYKKKVDVFVEWGALD